MTSVRLLMSAAALGAATLLSGCVVAPLGPRSVAYGQPVYAAPAQVYAAPPPVVIVPSVRFDYGYGGYYGRRHWR